MLTKIIRILLNDPEFKRAFMEYKPGSSRRNRICEAWCRYQGSSPSGLQQSVVECAEVFFHWRWVGNDEIVSGFGRKDLSADDCRRALNALGITFENAALYYPDPTEVKTPSKNTTQGTAMLNIENKTLVNGQDVKSLSDDQIFTLIAQTEKEIATLEAIGTKPKKLEAKIAALQQSITDLVAIVDAR